MATPRQAQLALTLAPPPTLPAATSSSSEQTPAVSGKPLWLCIYFPHLSLEVIAQNPDVQSAQNLQKPLAVTEEIRGHSHILTASRAARQAGVVAGLSSSAALALCPELTLCPRQINSEQQVLDQLAQWSYQFTPKLSLEFPQALLLEIKSSLLLFGGLNNLSQRIREGCQQQGYRPCLTVTPSPRASWLLARAGTDIQINQVDALRSTLGQLPLANLDLAPRTLQRLHKTGLNNLRDLWRLPRADLGRRYGLELLKTLDQISADQNHLIATFEQPLIFSAEQDLPIAMESWSQFWPAIQHLLKTLIDFLQRRNVATAYFELSFFHANNVRSELCIGLRKPSQNLDHLCLLVRERLSHYSLPASVIAVKLTTESIQPYQAEERHLFQPHNYHQNDESWQNLLDQLQARLGPDSIQTLTLNDDHRPECCQRSALYGTTEPKIKKPVQSSKQLSKQLSPQSSEHPFVHPTNPRPYWLLPQPKPLRITDYQIQPQGERIESGWWDQQPIRRDYHIATDHRGSRCWVFRELQQPERWYLHGLFG